MQSVHVSRRGDASILALKGRVDATTSNQVHERIMDEVEKGCKRMAIDFSEVSYVSSAGLRVLIYASKTLSKNSGTLSICALNDNIKKIFEISGLSKLFHITEDVASGLGLNDQKSDDAKGA